MPPSGGFARPEHPTAAARWTRHAGISPPRVEAPPQLRHGGRFLPATPQARVVFAGFPGYSGCRICLFLEPSDCGKPACRGRRRNHGQGARILTSGNEVPWHRIPSDAQKRYPRFPPNRCDKYRDNGNRFMNTLPGKRGCRSVEIVCSQLFFQKQRPARHSEKSYSATDLGWRSAKSSGRITYSDRSVWSRCDFSRV